MTVFRENKTITVFLLIFYAILTGNNAKAESLQGVSEFMAPEVNIEKEAFKKLIADVDQDADFGKATEELEFVRELAEKQPLSIAEKLVGMAPVDAGKFIIEEIPEDKRWRVLKKIPVKDIALMFDALSVDEAAMIIEQMRPLKAGLVLNEMKLKEAVFNSCSLDFKSVLLNTPGPKHIVNATIEEADFFRNGGLADILKNFPKESAEQGDIPVVFMPLWSGIDKTDLNYVGSFSVPMDSGDGSMRYHDDEPIYLHYTEVGDLVKYKIYFIENHKYFDVDKNGVFSGPMFERFILMAKAILEGVKYIDSYPDIIHCHEWQTGLIPVYLEAFYKEKGDRNFQNTIPLYSSHNPAIGANRRAVGFFLQNRLGYG